jgi:receptor protein-tyrosine kinase
VDYTDTSEKYRLQQPAEIPRWPISPVPAKVLGLGLGLGLAAGIGLGLLAEMLDQTYKTAEEIAKDVDIPVVATISRIDTVRNVANIDRFKQKAG